MKNIWIIIVLVGSSFTTIAQAGRYAGTKKALIGTVYRDPLEIQRLSDWTMLQGSILSQLSDPPMIAVNVFKKGTTYVVFFSIEDTVTKKFTIADVLEVQLVTKGWTIKTSFCRQNGVENPYSVAWVKETKTEYMTTVRKAWEFNTEKSWIDRVNVKGISCLNEGFDLTLMSLPSLKYIP
jgi:hypothetical protein